MTPEQLKASILQYAIQGKLVDQRSEEGTAEKLYQQIQEEKQQLIRDGKIKKEKPLTEITEEEIPFDIPESWKWCKMGELYNIHSSKRVHAKEYTKKGIPFYRSMEVVSLAKGIKPAVQYYISEEQYKGFIKDNYIMPKTDDLLITCIGGSIGWTWVVDDSRFYYKDGNIVAFDKCNCIDTKYLYYWLNSPTFIEKVQIDVGGTAYNALTIEMLKNYLLPLPPLEEQHRIVAKIEELLPYVDRYADAYEKLEKFNTQFPEDMKKSILQYAIQGKLVEQKPEEGTADDLYQQIQEEKKKLIRKGKIKKEKPLVEITEKEIPFDIPDSWKWIKLGDCSSYGQTKEKISPSEITKDMWSLDLEDIKKETGDILVKTMASERRISGDKVKFHKGQILYSKLRPYLKKILIAPDDGICTPELVPFNAYLIDEEYLVNVLKSPHVDYVINSVTYGVKMPRVGTDTMINLLIPLPPLEEQKRIVAKIKELIPYCDRLVK